MVFRERRSVKWGEVEVRSHKYSYDDTCLHRRELRHEEDVATTVGFGSIYTDDVI